VKKSTRAKMIAFYIVDLSTKTSRNTLFVDSIDSIIEKMAVMMRTAIEIEEKASLKRCFGTFLLFIVGSIGLQIRSQNYCDGIKRSISRMSE
jgi:hypothetical protein